MSNIQYSECYVSDKSINESKYITILYGTKLNDKCMATMNEAIKTRN